MEDKRLIRDEEAKVVTEIIVVADRSGSMNLIVEDAVGGFNSFLADQRESPDEAYLTLVRFDHEYEVVFESVPIQEMRDITKETIKPRGQTALLDAIGNTITDAMVRYVQSKNRKVIVVIITDGGENASETYSSDDIKDMVENCKKLGWEFMFLGANIDAFAEGRKLGVARGQTVQYEATSRGITTAYSNVSDTVSSFRSG